MKRYMLSHCEVSKVITDKIFGDKVYKSKDIAPMVNAQECYKHIAVGSIVPFRSLGEALAATVDFMTEGFDEIVEPKWEYSSKDCEGKWLYNGSFKTTFKVGRMTTITIEAVVYAICEPLPITAEEAASVTK